MLNEWHFSFLMGPGVLNMYVVTVLCCQLMFRQQLWSRELRCCLQLFPVEIHEVGQLFIMFIEYKASARVTTCYKQPAWLQISLFSYNTKFTNKKILLLSESELLYSLQMPFYFSSDGIQECSKLAAMIHKTEDEQR